KIPVMTQAPAAWWVVGDAGLKGVTSMVIENQDLIVEEVATVFPVSNAVLMDSGYPLDRIAQPLVMQALAQKVDDAILWGTNSPASFPASVVANATAAGNVVPQDPDDVAASWLDAAALVAEQGMNVTGVAIGNGQEFRAARQRTMQLVVN